MRSRRQGKSAMLSILSAFLSGRRGDFALAFHSFQAGQNGISIEEICIILNFSGFVATRSFEICQVL